MRYFFSILLISFSVVGATNASDFAPDPASVQREGAAYRYPQAGWIVLHIEGDPYERGVQHGKLLAPEIADYIKAYATILAPKSPSEGWKMTRRMVDALFVRKFDPELLEEMKGIADGASAAGAKFDGRAIDLTDIVAINAWPEIDSLDDALRATPNGLEGKKFGQPDSAARASTQKAARCSAFAATGAATKDGKAIIGHITMFDLYPCNFYNVWIDIKPTKGHRVILQGSPGSVQSGMDWYQNDAGIVLVETTIDQTKFNSDGLSVGSRSRHAMQYGDSIDAVTTELARDNNGLYTNEWLLADMKTNEIAMFELGTGASAMFRSSKNEWFGGTEGFYWGCNNTKDTKVRLDTLASTKDRPADVVFCPVNRDMAWVKLYEQYKGKIDGDFGKIAYSKPPLVSRNSCDAKYTTADLALQMKANAIFGDPYGQLRDPSQDEFEKFPDIKPIVPNPWTILTGNTPAKSNDESLAVDLKNNGSDASPKDKEDDDDSPDSPLAWHGTILPASDGDIWLATAFAKFQDYASTANQFGKDLIADNRDALGVKLFESHSQATTMTPQPPRNAKMNPADDQSIRSATARGVLMLAELRRRIGAEKFDPAMDTFGRDHAGKPATTDSFITAMQNINGADLKDFFHAWLETADGLPTLALADVEMTQAGGSFTVKGSVVSRGGCPPANVDVTLERDSDEITVTVNLDNGKGAFEIPSDAKPTRVIANKYGLTPATNGYRFSASSYKRDLEHALIIYGTRDNAIANAIAAEALQKSLIDTWEHAKLPIKADTNISDADLRGHHLLLIGGPGSNELSARFQTSLPVKFGAHSFSARGVMYAHMDSAVIVAAENPLDKNFSIVCIEGLDAGAIYRAAQSAAGWAPAPIRILPARTGPRDIVPPAPELVHEFP